MPPSETLALLALFMLKMYVQKCSTAHASAYQRGLSSCCCIGNQPGEAELQTKQEVLTTCAACRSLAWLRLSKHVQESP